MYRALQNRCVIGIKRIWFLQKFDFFKMSGESEHSESAFYYPGGLIRASSVTKSLVTSKVHKERKYSLQMKTPFISF